MPFIIDYKEEIKKLISDSYEPADTISKEFRITTYEIVDFLKNILPENAVNDHLVYEALLELGFMPKEEAPLQYYWYFKRVKE